MEISELIAGSTLFRVLSDQGRGWIAERSRIVEFGKNDVLYRIDDPSDRYFGVLQGRVRFCASTPDGKAMTSHYAHEGDWFGEIGLFEGGSRIINCEADCETRVAILSASDLQAIARKEPQMYEPIVGVLTERIRQVGQLLQGAVFQDLSARLAGRLIELAEQSGKEDVRGILIDMHLPHEQLGQLVGATREAVSRQLNLWKKNGWVDVAYGKVTLTDLPALSQIAFHENTAID